MKIKNKFLYPQSPPAPPRGYEIYEVSHVTESSAANPNWDFNEEVGRFAHAPWSTLEAFAVPKNWDDDIYKMKRSLWDKIKGRWSKWEAV